MEREKKGRGTGRARERGGVCACLCEGVAGRYSLLMGVMLLPPLPPFQPFQNSTCFFKIFSFSWISFGAQRNENGSFVHLGFAFLSVLFCFSFTFFIAVSNP